jgi:sigma-E factor negative regulatory protein RseB
MIQPNIVSQSPARVLASLCIIATVTLLVIAVPVQAQPSTASSVQSKKAAEWLERVAKSARELPYTGVYVHQTTEGSTTSRITHLVDRQGNEHEKLEMLDGPLMEVVRRNEEMFCYHPDQKMVRVDRRATGRFFPSLITGSPAAIAENYNVKMGPVERIAGHDCQWLILEPKDAMRYMQKLCAEVGTGLLLRARMYNDRKQLLEQFMFTQLDVTGGVSKQTIRSRFDEKGWPRDYSIKTNLKTADTGWQVGSLPAGFRKVTEMVRNLTGRKDPVAHLVYSDGLLHVSVFVEPTAGVQVQPSNRMSDEGPISLAIRPVNDYQVTVMGEVPMAAVQKIADSVSRRR